VATPGRGRNSVSISVGGRGSYGANNGGGRCWSIIINTTIFPPISEGAFIDTKDLLPARYQQASDCTEGVHCGMSVFGNSKTTMNATKYLLM
jgi:hypothetical protein